MSPEIAVYFGHLEQRLLDSDAVSSYVIIRREVTPADGKVRIRARLKDGGSLELFEYVALEAGGHVVRLKYSYHWQNAEGVLVSRWDAVAHHPQLPYAPHHVHMSDGSVEGVMKPPDAMAVLAYIEAELRQG